MRAVGKMRHVPYGTVLKNPQSQFFVMVCSVDQDGPYAHNGFIAMVVKDKDYVTGRQRKAGEVLECGGLDLWVVVEKPRA